MTIDRLGEKTILVTLSREDLERYQLDFEGNADDARTRRGLTRLMVHIGKECDLDHHNKSYLIEALPGRENCLLIISVRISKPRRKYRIKRDSRVECCTFLSADDLLDWLSRPECARMSYSLYRETDRYYMIPDYPWKPSERRILSEYGCVTPLSPVFVARLREYSAPIAVHSCHRRQFRYASSAAI